jgi:hypothetical protein
MEVNHFAAFNITELEAQACVQCAEWGTEISKQQAFVEYMWVAAKRLATYHS